MESAIWCRWKNGRGSEFRKTMMGNLRIAFYRARGMADFIKNNLFGHAQKKSLPKKSKSEGMLELLAVKLRKAQKVFFMEPMVAGPRKALMHVEGEEIEIGK